MILRAFSFSLAAVWFVACSSSSALTGANPTAQFSLANPAVTETVLHSFTGGAKDGSAPISRLTKVGNVFYGTTGGGGSKGKGTIFSISPTGTGFTVLHSFSGKGDGTGSAAGLTNVDGTLYGTSQNGGTGGNGTVFSITLAGSFTTLYSFKGGSADGAQPVAGLTIVRGTLYGTTSTGGNVNGCWNCGTVFSISTSGKEKVLHFFGSKTGDGIGPRSPLVNVEGKLYGTTADGGDGFPGDGTIFSVTTGGKETLLHKFKSAVDGNCNFNCYLSNLGGTLYGTAYFGGKERVGSVFSITRGGSFKTLYSALRDGTGVYPQAAVTNSADTLYGTMSLGPRDKGGVLFSMTTGGTLQTIYSFAGGSDGATPTSKLILVGGKLFGATARGGSSDLGTIYSVAGF